MPAVLISTHQGIGRSSLILSQGYFKAEVINPKSEVDNIYNQFLDPLHFLFVISSSSYALERVPNMVNGTILVLAIPIRFSS